ncbi:Sn-glycerol-3-phosphate ABC transporter periplasmic binding protein, fragment [Erwinia pyrifoliae Ep1/96]|nr:Sn-glycerol-3-phosphate ABC transporter periplasmic binding protein, fragment [Erwinia pyrifoliae Ep1/96]
MEGELGVEVNALATRFNETHPDYRIVPTCKGVAEFMQFLAQPDRAAEWHQKTGYLPIITAAYDLAKRQGFCQQHPGADIATRQMLN